MSIQYAPLSEFALLKIEGEDSLSFLQGQLSQDMNAIRGATALLASYSNPKGRVFATLLLWQADDEANSYYALVSADNAAFLQKRLSMFVLRAKVKISVIEAQLTGVWSNDFEVLKQAFPAAQAISTQAQQTDKPSFTVIADNEQYFIHYPSSDTAIRLLNVVVGEHSHQFDEFTLSSSQVWQQQDILAGIPWIKEQTREVFVAQSINQDAIGAINFKKGCYPGQEVIARSHYLGNLKRRTLIATLNQAIDNTQSLLASDVLEGENPIGQVVNAVTLDDKTYLLIEVQLRSIEDGAEITLANMAGTSLQVQTVPYSLEKPE